MKSSKYCALGKSWSHNQIGNSLAVVDIMLIKWFLNVWMVLLDAFTLCSAESVSCHLKNLLERKFLIALDALLSKTSKYVINLVFKKCNWMEFYRDANEDIPINAPKSRGTEVDIHILWIVSLVYVNIALVQWCEKNSLQYRHWYLMLSLLPWSRALMLW